MDKRLLIVLVLAFGMNVVLADGLGELSNIVWGIACDVYRLLLPVAFLAMIAAAVIYAFGQVGHAEMRAKAQSWAMWALVAGIVALIILLIMPTILNTLFKAAVTTSAGADFPNCCGSGAGGCSLANPSGCTGCSGSTGGSSGGSSSSSSPGGTPFTPPGGAPSMPSGDSSLPPR